MAFALLPPIQTDRQKQKKGGDMTKSKKTHNLSSWIIAAGLTGMTAAGCA
jgi:hypothetical protein